jgi:hypothetical protein
VTQPTPPLLGYNNNVRYRGRTFHIQTEDSGTQYARIVTHLFVDGGRIVKSTRAQYAELLGQADRAEVVRRMMKEQHKAMFLSLRAGEFDAAIERIVGAGEPSLTSMPSSVDIEPQSVRSDAFSSSGIAAVSSANHAPVAASREASSEQVSAVQPTGVGQRSLSNRGKEQAKPAEVPSAGKSRRSHSSVPASPRRSRVVDDPTPAELLPPTAPMNTGRPSERLQRVPQPLANAAPQEALDPRNRSIFGDTGEGRQSLDEVILSFLEDEES